MQKNPVTLIKIVEQAQTPDGYLPVTLATEQGEVECRLYNATEKTCGIICVGGAGGGWDTPAGQLYPRLCKELVSKGINGLRVRFRDPHDLQKSVFDLLSGVKYLQTKRVSVIGLIGHSFGGAVVIQAASMDQSIKAVITLASQGHGTDAASSLGPHCALLSIHGENDRILSDESSRRIFKSAKEPKKLTTYPNAGHVLDEVALEVYHEVTIWISTYVTK
jgi:dienelactone hydrolase